MQPHRIPNPSPRSQLRNIQVPEQVYKAWEAGGAERTNLVKLFQEAGLDKDWCQSSHALVVVEIVGGLLVEHYW